MPLHPIEPLSPDAARELAKLGQQLATRREAILYTWRREVRKDPDLTTADSLPRGQLDDHIPSLLIAYECRLDPELAVPDSGAEPRCEPETQSYAAAHGLHRWQQGYDLQELVQELGRLNECVVLELEAYGTEHAGLAPAVMTTARWMWAQLIADESSQSIGEYFRLQQIEAAGHISDLEQALENIRELEQQRATLWHEATHDLRGNLGVVVSATAGLQKSVPSESSQANFVRVLDRNVKSLHQLLDEVTDLARLQAGRERLLAAPIDVGSVFVELCNALNSRTQERGLYLRSSGPETYLVEGDAIKIRRIAQNLAINAIKYTREGGVSIHWGDSDGADDTKRWMLCVADTGPGFDLGPGAPLVAALGEGTDLSHQQDKQAGVSVPKPSRPEERPAPHQEAGEGIGLTIVKRLAELLHASVEVQSALGQGTTFKVYLPKAYPT